MSEEWLAVTGELRPPSEPQSFEIPETRCSQLGTLRFAGAVVVLCILVGGWIARTKKFSQAG